MKIKPSRALQITVALATVPAALAIAYTCPNGWLKWLAIGCLLVFGGVTEWMIDRALINAEKSAL
ncbi:hypothetical protein [Undibacterium sp.]|uniref:hypothetical protein n=1 Tax=Undibacterium sp. TaxID=1914977 RepID=UPI003751D69B